MTYAFKLKESRQPEVKLLEAIPAPEDLGELLTYNDAVKKVASLKNWHGFDGCDFKNEAELMAAFENGTYNGGWFIPPKDLLLKMYDNKDASYRTASGSVLAHWYWSCTERRDNSDVVYNVDFADGDDEWNLKGNCRLSSRVVRVELCV
jgi:hypothetical protein